MQKETVYISGIRRGIGRALGLACASQGARVAGFSRQQTGLPELATHMTDAGAAGVWTATADLASQRSLNEWYALAAREVGAPTIVVHAAAVLGPRRQLHEIDTAEWAHVLDINATGAFRLLRAVGRQAVMDAPRLWLWLSSSVGAHGRAAWGPYAASKAALENMHQTFADEIDGSAWDSIVVNPGGTQTDMRREAYPDEDPSNLPSPDDIAAVLLDIIRAWRQGQLTNGARLNARDYLA